MIRALPLEKIAPLLVHSMVVSAHCVDMQYPNTPTEMEVASALDKKSRVFVVEGIIAVFQLD